MSTLGRGFYNKGFDLYVVNSVKFINGDMMTFGF